MIVKDKLLRYEDSLSPFAAFDRDAKRLNDICFDIRPEYFRDTDRIIYSKAYLRYMDKTQVFSNVQNDHITRRMSHVMMVSKIARTIGRALSLNEDLIEAIALGHDLGHVPFGHLGESFLNDISVRNNEGVFMHNVQSVRNLMFLEKNGHGLNLTVQVLDGILCHNGEILKKEYKPVKKDVDTFLREYNECYDDIENILRLRPMTLEGCVVRISDFISYIGKDIEDAIMLGILKRDEIPVHIKNILGSTNNDIITSIVVDIIDNSMDKPYITMSDEVNKALDELKTFNYENIYYKAVSIEQRKIYKDMFEFVFSENLKFVESCNHDADIYKVFLCDMSKDYLKNTTSVRKVIDYIAGMTDSYFIKEYDKMIAKKNK